MPRRTVLTVILTVLLGAAGAYLLPYWWNVHRHAAKHGALTVPSHKNQLCGRYRKGDGTEAVYLTLSSNGTYSSALYSDIGVVGQADAFLVGKVVGTWTVHRTNLILAPSKEAGMIKGYLAELDIYRVKTNWVFVRALDRREYEEFGITEGPLFHFEKDQTK